MMISKNLKNFGAAGKATTSETKWKKKEDESSYSGDSISSRIYEMHTFVWFATRRFKCTWLLNFKPTNPQRTVVVYNRNTVIPFIRVLCIFKTLPKSCSVVMDPPM
jgi:hypothetical protein